MHAFVPIVAFLGLVAAQSETSSGTATSTSSSVGTDPTTACLAECEVDDVNCKALCVNVPAPDEDQINATNECSRNECTQGDSGPEDTKKYGECLASCAADFYYTSGGSVTGVATGASSATGASTPNNSSAETTGTDSSASSTGSSASQTGSSSDSSETESSATSSASESAESAASSASDAAASESTGAASALTLGNGMIASGVVGLMVAAIAL